LAFKLILCGSIKVIEVKSATGYRPNYVFPLHLLIHPVRCHETHNVVLIHHEMAVPIMFSRKIVVATSFLANKMIGNCIPVGVFWPGMFFVVLWLHRIASFVIILLCWFWWRIFPSTILIAHTTPLQLTTSHTWKHIPERILFKGDIHVHRTTFMFL
jgi:hypothetical protein